MPVYYDGIENITNVNGTMSLSDFVVSVDTHMFGAGTIGLVILFTLFALFFFMLLVRGYRAVACFAVACWIVGISAFLLRALSLLGDRSFYVAVALIPIALVAIWVSTALDI